MLRRLLVSLLLTGIPVGFASAAPIPVTMQFTATGFDPSAPDVTGSIRWLADSPTAAVQQFTSISLEIAGHPYDLLKDDIEFFNISTPQNSDRVGIGAGPGSGLDLNTNDFLISWFLLDPLNAEGFQYSDGSGFGIFGTQTFKNFSVTADAANGTGAPEPATGVLLGLALSGLALMRRRSAS